MRQSYPDLVLLVVSRVRLYAEFTRRLYIFVTALNYCALQTQEPSSIRMIRNIEFLRGVWRDGFFFVLARKVLLGAELTEDI